MRAPARARGTASPSTLRLEPITPEAWAASARGLAVDVDDLPRAEPGAACAWWVCDDGQALVGVVAEYRTWTQGRCGPATYDVAHNPTATPGGALWASRRHPSPAAALAALAAHLQEGDRPQAIRPESSRLSSQADAGADLRLIRPESPAAAPRAEGRRS